METFVFQLCSHFCVFSFFVRTFQVTCMKCEMKKNLQTYDIPLTSYARQTSWEIQYSVMLKKRFINKPCKHSFRSILHV